ncbi:MAG: hypothetical protein ABIQ18_10510 [Umezawaea sp.]
MATRIANFLFTEFPPSFNHVNIGVISTLIRPEPVPDTSRRQWVKSSYQSKVRPAAGEFPPSLKCHPPGSQVAHLRPGDLGATTMEVSTHRMNLILLKMSPTVTTAVEIHPRVGLRTIWNTGTGIYRIDIESAVSTGEINATECTSLDGDRRNFAVNCISPIRERIRCKMAAQSLVLLPNASSTVVYAGSVTGHDEDVRSAVITGTARAKV